MKIAEKLAGIFDKQRRAAREIVDAIEEPRLEIMALREERNKIRMATIAATEVQKRIAEELAPAEERARGLIHGNALVTPSGGSFVTKSGVCEAFSKEPLGALLVLGFRDDIFEALAKMAAGEAAGRGKSYTEAERAKELARIDTAIREAERHEEQLCRLAEGSGISVTRRIDASMEFILAEDL